MERGHGARVRGDGLLMGCSVVDRVGTGLQDAHRRRDDDEHMAAAILIRLSSWKPSLRHFRSGNEKRLLVQIRTKTTSSRISIAKEIGLD